MVMPILYSFRRCPYAMRARLAISAAEQQCELREVVLKDKPHAMLEASPKGTVPVLILDGNVIDESIDIMRWALLANAPEAWSIDEFDDILVKHNDDQFKHYLDRYKYYDRYPERSQEYYFEKALVFLQGLESNLVQASNGGCFLKTPQSSGLDAAIVPFVRQFAFVDKPRFDQLSLPKVKAWLNAFLESDNFHAIMLKYPQWSSQQEQTILFGV